MIQQVNSSFTTSFAYRFEAFLEQWRPVIVELNKLKLDSSSEMDSICLEFSTKLKNELICLLKEQPYLDATDCDKDISEVIEWVDSMIINGEDTSKIGVVLWLNGTEAGTKMLKQAVSC